MGNDTVTQKNLKIIDVRDQENVLLVHGTIPGAKNGILNIYSKA
jgi:large subunit ribosomal protein L3